MKFIFICAVVILISDPALAHIGLPPQTLASYNRAKILLAHYGDKEIQALRAKVLTVRQNINSRVFGQDDLAAAIETRLDQYLNSVGTRRDEPIALHMIGLTGIGKSSIIKTLEELGFPIFRINAEKFPGGEAAANSEWKLMEAFEKAISLQRNPHVPLILFIDEIDKVPELLHDGATETQPVIGHLNEILSEGALTHTRQAGKKLNFSNIFIMTAMNFAPSHIDKFSHEILKEKKSYWDFTEADMKTFDEWIRSGDQSAGSVSKLLSLLFRSNTVGRLGPDAIIAKALVSEDFDEIVKHNVHEVVQRLTSNKTAGLSVTIEQPFKDFLRRSTTFAPSGARMSVKRIDLLTEQLVSIATRADLGNEESLSLPRNLKITFDPAKQEAVVDVQALSKYRRAVKVEARKTLHIPFSKATSSFQIPPGMIKPLPKNIAEATAEFAEREAAVKRATPKQVRDLRLSLQNDHGLEKHLNELVHDQSEIAHELDERMHLYMNSEEAAVHYLTVYGFHGVGKTKLFKEAAEYYGIPLVKMNMQEYSGDSQESSDRFGQDLYEKIEAALEESESGKYLLLFEEIDKVFEINPMDGTLHNRPVMSYIKDLLSDGARTVNISNAYNSEQKTIDISGAFTGLTMNFGIDRYELKPDPRLTTIDDMEQIYRKLKNSPNEVYDVLASLFLPETINRLLGKNLIPARPLTEKGYEQILKDQFEEVLRQLSSSENSELNHGELKINTSKAYFKNYLYSESVVPSQGGRQAEKKASTLLLHDVLQAIQNLPKGTPLMDRPIEIMLDYKGGSSRTPSTVIAQARLSEKADREKAKGDLKQLLYKAPRELQFPPLAEFGSIPARRLFVAAHEFGHAFTHIVFGSRFEVAVCEMPDGTGYVKTGHSHTRTGHQLLAGTLGLIGSRAMERIILGKKPLDPSSALKISNGSDQDVAMLTSQLWKIVHQWGMDPGGAIIERSGLGGNERNDYNNRTYHFEGLSDEKITQLGLVARDLEDFVVARLLEMHNIEWYRERITTFARAGSMKEHEFYDLVGYKYPGDNSDFIGEEMQIQGDFASDIEPEEETVKAARLFKQGNGLTAVENLNRAVAAFQTSLSNRLHDGDEPSVCEDIVAGPNKKKSRKKKSSLKGNSP